MLILARYRAFLSLSSWKLHSSEALECPDRLSVIVQILHHGHPDQWKKKQDWWHFHVWTCDTVEAADRWDIPGILFFVCKVRGFLSAPCWHGCCWSYCGQEAYGKMGNICPLTRFNPLTLNEIFPGSRNLIIKPYFMALILDTNVWWKEKVQVNNRTECTIFVW